LADPSSALALLTVPKQTDQHNGGTLLFGPDGYLYVSIGDDGGHESSVSQELNSYLGKILRLDVSDLHGPYKIPVDNPFVNVPNALPEIWAYGLRNPWRMAFDAQTSDLYITDVGLFSREEVDIQPAGKGAGANYGWPWYEGNKAMKIKGADSVDSNEFVFPVTDYDHTSFGGCAIIGGNVYYGKALPQIKGKYLFSDYCYGFIWALEVTEHGNGHVETLMRDPNLHPSAFAVDGDGEFYLLDIGTGNMFKLTGK
jgi:glucose/arabinose dehydrogenase